MRPETGDRGPETADGGRPKTQTGDQRRRTADSGRRTADSGRRTANRGQLFPVPGPRSAVPGLRSAVCGPRSAVPGLRSAVLGLWSAVPGPWSPVSGPPSPVSGPQSPVPGLPSAVRRLWSAVLLLLLLAGCIPAGAVEVVAPDTVTMTQSAPTPAGTETPLPPPIIVAPTTTPLPAFAPISAAEIAAKQATVDAGLAAAIAAAVTEPPTTAEALPTDAPSLTPMPTFTPPALPNTPPWEHYWFRRPVSIDGVLWTNKHYGYGSTRGGQLRTHHGVEFDVPYNTEILAVASGTVIVAGDDLETAYGPHTNFYGNLVVIEHDSALNGQPVFTLYAHLTQPLVAVGQHVDAEQVIALSGASGVADGPHMHFEVRVGANSYANTRNPLLWLYPFPNRGTVAGRVTFSDGSLAYEAPVTLTRIDGEAPFYGATTYADDAVNADEGWDENFAIDDVVAGYYEVEVKVGNREYKQEFWVYPFQTSFVEIVLN